MNLLETQPHAAWSAPSSSETLQPSTTLVAMKLMKFNFASIVER